MARRMTPKVHLGESHKKTGQICLLLRPSVSNLKIKQFGRFIRVYPVQSLHAHLRLGFLLRASAALLALKLDEEFGVTIVRRACEDPVRQIG